MEKRQHQKKKKNTRTINNHQHSIFFFSAPSVVYDECYGLYLGFVVWFDFPFFFLPFFLLHSSYVTSSLCLMCVWHLIDKQMQDVNFTLRVRFFFVAASRPVAKIGSSKALRSRVLSRSFRESLFLSISLSLSVMIDTRVHILTFSSQVIRRVYMMIT